MEILRRFSHALISSFLRRFAVQVNILPIVTPLSLAKLPSDRRLISGGHRQLNSPTSEHLTESQAKRNAARTPRERAISLRNKWAEGSHGRRREQELLGPVIGL